MVIVPIIIVCTTLISFLCLQNESLQQRFVGYPYATYHFREWKRVLTAGFIHSDALHLTFNLVTLHSFSHALLASFYHRWHHSIGVDILFLLCYLGGITIANIFTCYRYRNNRFYQHVGASAGVSAIMAASILCAPNQELTFLFFPFVAFPGWLFLPCFLLYSFLARHNTGRIDHFSHFIGGLVGVFFVACVAPDIFRKMWCRLQGATLE